MKDDPKYTGQKLKLVGTRVLRPDGVDKVTGRAKYGADMNAPGQLIGAVLRSPHAHAEIKSINTSKAEKLPGVKAVITSADLPDHTNGNSEMMDVLENCMARKKALYDGHAVAAVAAVDAETARQALKLIKVHYKKLRHVTDVDKALKPNAPVVQPRVGNTNNAGTSTYGHGDIDAGFEKADVIIEKSYKTEQVHQGYIEPHACLASLGPDGKGELWVTTQGPFGYRNVCAELLGLDISQLKVTSSEIGGGFGGKTHVWTEPLALALSRKAGRPVKLVMSREEVFKGSGPASATSIDIKLGATKDGRLVAGYANLRYSDGAFWGFSGYIGAMVAFACYDIENVKADGIEVVCNRPKVAAYRAPSAPMAGFAVESTVNLMAEALGMDPLDFRMKNASREGTKASYGPTYGPIGLIPTLKAVKKHPQMRKRLGKNQGRGMACGFWFNFGGQTCADLTIEEDGTVALSVGTVDVGGARASLSLICAEELGIPYEQVRTNIADTASLGHNDMTDGSRGTFSSGMSTIFAARDAIEKLKGRAAKMWKTSVKNVEWTDGKAIWKAKRKSLTVAEIAAKSARTGGPITGHNQTVADGAGVSFASHICDVEVDPETGATKILRYAVIQDAGKAVHPDYVEGQFQGGAAQGIGWALNEEYVYGTDGKVQNAGFLDYRIPVCSDLPFIDTEILEIPNPNHPYGIRGVGETSIVPPLAAIANAIADATGTRMDHVPMSPPRILAALKADREEDKLAS